VNLFCGYNSLNEPETNYLSQLSAFNHCTDPHWLGGNCRLVIFFPTFCLGFFVFGIMALTGTSLPVVYFLHHRFPSDPPAGSNVIVREALWVGVYGATLAWLQLGRLVTLYVILGLAGGLIAIEYFIRLREKANRIPPVIVDDNPS
jgi:hypothetical protein